MRINDLLLEATHPLFETVLPSYHPTVKLGEDIARVLIEAALTADQINALFQQVQKQVSAGGGNRTAIGKGVDAAVTVKKAYDYVKQLAQDSGPVTGFDSAFDKVANELKNATGGDQGVMKYIQKYRDFAKAHPIAQKVIYSTLVLGAGIAAYGALGPAGIALKPAIIGTMKFTDKLLQGEKFSSAAVAGLETFAAAEIMSKVGAAVKSFVGGGNATGLPKPATGAGAAADAATDAASGGTLSARQAAQSGLKQLKDLVASGEVKDYESYRTALRNITKELRPQIVPSAEKGLGLFPLDGEIERLMGGEAAQASGGKISGGTANILKKFIEINGGTPDEQSFATGEKLRQQMIGQMQGDEKAFAAKGAAPEAGSNAAASDTVTGTSPTSKGVSIIKKMLASGEIKTPEDFKAALKTAAEQSGYRGPNMVQGGVSNIQSAFQSELRDAGYGPKVRLIDQDFVDTLIKNAAPKVNRGATSSVVGFDKVDMSIPALTEAQVMAAFAGTRFNPSLTESQVRTVFRHIEEGPFDAIRKAGAAIAGSRVGQAVKGAATSAGQKIATGAQNLTTKTTADKLNRAWQAAGSPMDSAAIYKFLQQQGVDDATLKAAFGAAKIAIPKASTAVAVSPQYKQVSSMITKLQPADRQKLIAYLQQQVGQTATA